MRYPDKYPTLEAVGDRFKLSKVHVSRMIEHYEFLEELKLPRGNMLPEGIMREVRRAPKEVFLLEKGISL